MAYGSLVRRQGRSRREARYQVSKSARTSARPKAAASLEPEPLGVNRYVVWRCTPDSGTHVSDAEQSPAGPGAEDRPMNMPVVMHDEEFRQIAQVCDRLCREANARVVFVIDKNGQLMASSGETERLD